ncbi:hypothetical protein Ancab_032133 [Ancistrocladus abbreviatus]
MGEETKLYGSLGSPYSLRVEIALQIKGVKYEHIEQDLKNKSPDLLKYNPIHKKIPVFVHNGKSIMESLIILEYIDENWRHNRILPVDPYERSIVRFWTKFIDDKVLSSVHKYYFIGEESEREKAKEEASEGLQILESELKGKKFFGGETYGMLDIAAIGVAWTTPALQEAAGKYLLSRESFPLISKWSEELTSCKVFQENLPSKDTLISHYRPHIAVANPSK